VLALAVNIALTVVLSAVLPAKSASMTRAEV